nr:hypothetical protein [Tanacetum cinerariifolium]
MFLNVEQLEKQLDKEDFQEIGSIAAFNVLETQFQMFITSRLYLDDEYVAMTRSYFIQYTQQAILEFCDTLIQHFESVKNRSGNDAHNDDANIRPIYDEEPMAKVQTTAEINVFAIGQQHIEQPEFNNEGEVDQNAKECHDTCPLPAILTNNQIPEHSYQISKPQCDSQVDVNYDLSKPVTTHYSPKEREAVSAKPHHMIASSNSRISSKNMLRFSSNYMVHDLYLEEAKKKTQERSRNSEPSLMPSARSQSTANDSKPEPRSNTQISRNWPASKSTFATTKTVPIEKHPRNSRNFSDLKHFVCSTCQKCVFNANHDSCVTKFLKEVNSRTKVPSNKTTNINKPIEQISVAKKPERQIVNGHRFSIKKTFVVHEKTMTPRSCLRWKPTGRIFKIVGLRWISNGKIFASSTTKVDSEPLNGSNVDITNQYECEQTLDVSAGTLNLSEGTSFNPKEEGLRLELRLHDHINEQSSSKLVPDVVPPADKTATSRQELEFLFHHHITMLRSYALSWKLCQGDSLNLPDHRIRRRCCSLIPVESDSTPYAHAQTTKIY